MPELPDDTDPFVKAFESAVALRQQEGNARAERLEESGFYALTLDAQTNRLIETIRPADLRTTGPEPYGFLSLSGHPYVRSPIPSVNPMDLIALAAFRVDGNWPYPWDHRQYVEARHELLVNSLRRLFEADPAAITAEIAFHLLRRAGETQ